MMARQRVAELALDESLGAAPAQTMVWVGVVIWVATTACTVLPTLGSLRTPPPRVIARLVAA